MSRLFATFLYVPIHTILKDAARVPVSIISEDLEARPTTEMETAKSRIGRVFRSFGVPVSDYASPALQWRRPLWVVVAIVPLYLLVVVSACFPGLKHPLGSPRRRRAGVLAIGFVVLFPFLWGSQSSGSIVVDFALAVVAFVDSLRLYRIFFMREAAETATWSKAEYVSRLVTFPTELVGPKLSTLSRTMGHARWENAKDLVRSVGKMLVSLVLIRCIPPPEAFLDMSWWQNRLYHALLGFILLLCLEGFVGGFFAAWGVLLDRHQRHMFNRPLISAGFRDLWSRRWNLPVHDVLHGVVFEGMTFPISRWMHASHRYERHTPEHANRTYRENVQAAFLTFLVSGLFHEGMSYMAFGQIRGANIVYFSWNALGCSLEVFLHRRYPTMKAVQRRWWFRVLFVSLWAWGSESYTDGYLNYGFFEEAKTWIGLIAPPFAIKEIVWLLGKPSKGGPW